MCRLKSWCLITLPALFWASWTLSPLLVLTPVLWNSPMTRCILQNSQLNCSIWTTSFYRVMFLRLTSKRFDFSLHICCIYIGFFRFVLCGWSLVLSTRHVSNPYWYRRTDYICVEDVDLGVYIAPSPPLKFFVNLVFSGYSSFIPPPSVCSMCTLSEKCFISLVSVVHDSVRVCVRMRMKKRV